MKGLIAVLLAGLAFGVEVQQEKVLEELERLKEKGMLSEEMMRKIEEYGEYGKRVRKKAEEKVKRWEVKRKDGKLVVREKEEKKREVRRTVYIFMSSSVPEEVWEVYMDHALAKNIPAVFLLRGCIGGCRYIRPTLEFIRKVVGERPVEVWIDPLKFREYGVKVVPCVAVEGKRKLSCGDWNLEYHLAELGVW